MDIEKIIRESPFGPGQIKDASAIVSYFDSCGVPAPLLFRHVLPDNTGMRLQRQLDAQRKPCECGSTMVLIPADDPDACIWMCQKCGLSIWDGRPAQTIIEEYGK